MTRLFRRLEEGQLALGALVLTPGCEYVELMGHAGLDFVVIQLMTTSNDWADLGNLVRAAARYDVTTIAWLQGFPWGNQGYDARLPADVLRALSIGCDGAFASVNNRQQVEAMVNVSGNSHSRPWIRDMGIANPFPRSDNPKTSISDIFNDQEVAWRARRMVAPLIEDKDSLDHLEEMLSVPNLRGFALGMGDLTRELGHPGEYLHPDLQAAVRKAVDIGNKYDLVPIANVGIPMQADSIDGLLEGVTWMWENGVPAVMIPHPTFAAQWFYERVGRLLGPTLSGARPPLT
jgi:2-keto-3-deoxy-L-rhamnonate aldolase RhmA